MSTIVKDLGIATAYGYAVSKGYTGTEEEFAQLMANYATVGQTATEAAGQAASSAEASGVDSLKSEGYSVGKQSGEDVEEGSPYYHNNAKYYAEEAKDSETNAGNSESAASGSASDAEANSLKSEGFAVGKQDGTAVTSGSPYYQNNSKYYSKQSAASAATSAAMTGLAPAFSASKAYAAGDYVLYNGTLYRFAAAHAAGAWTGSDATAVTLGPDVTDLKSALTQKLDTYLGDDNVIYEQQSMSVGTVGGTYQRADFYTYEGTILEGDNFGFLSSGVTGATNSSPIRIKLLNGSTTIRETSNPTNATIEILASDITAGINKVVAYVYASTTTPLSQVCVVSKPKFIKGIDYSFTYSGNFDSKVNGLILSAINARFFGGTITNTSVYASCDDLPNGTTFVITSAASLTNKPASEGTITTISRATNETTAKAQVFFEKSGKVYVRSLWSTWTDWFELATNVVNPCFWKESDECGTFKKILCIGDSLTAGQFDYKEDGVIKEFNDQNYAYPAFLKALTGRDTTNAGDAGETTVSWYTLHGSEDFSGHDACIIHLGRNDYSGSNNVSSADRIQAMNNIIAKVKTDNPQIKIFISTQINYYTYANVGIINEDMATVVANNNGCYLLDIFTYGKLVFSKDAYSHLTAVGYKKLAEYYFNYISYIMNNNQNDFKTVQFTGTNRSY